MQWFVKPVVIIIIIIYLGFLLKLCQAKKFMSGNIKSKHMTELSIPGFTTSFVNTVKTYHNGRLMLPGVLNMEINVMEWRISVCDAKSSKYL